MDAAVHKHCFERLFISTEQSKDMPKKLNEPAELSSLFSSAASLSRFALCILDISCLEKFLRDAFSELSNSTASLKLAIFFSVFNSALTAAAANDCSANDGRPVADSRRRQGCRRRDTDLLDLDCRLFLC